jgi:Zn-dependent protease/predicted transcriptional regulator
MKNSLSIGRVAGIHLFIHWTFPLLLGWVIFSNLRAGRSLDDTLWSLLFVLAVFVCVILHELGHALAARRYGIQTKDITLLPIGGLARLERMPEKPSEELVVAAAGPLVNVIIAAIMFPIVLMAGSLKQIGNAEVISSGNFLVSFLAVNVWLVLFNLIPAFPMDGGRMLRALLALGMDRTKATRIAARIGQVFAIGFMIAGLFMNPFLIFIGFFIFISARSESEYTSSQSILRGFRVKDLLMNQYYVLNFSDPLKAAVSALLDGQSRNFIVMENGNLAGTLSRDEIIRGLNAYGEEVPVQQVMNPKPAMLDINMPLEEAWNILRTNKSMLPVISDGVFVGTLDEENILEFIMVSQTKK